MDDLIDTPEKAKKTDVRQLEGDGFPWKTNCVILGHRAWARF
jgi:hypothetical protein